MLSNKNTKAWIKILIASILLTLIVCGSASAFSGGSGTETDPFIVSNQNDLQEIASAPDESYFKIPANTVINVTSTFTSIPKFQGHLYGEGDEPTATISGLTVPFATTFTGGGGTHGTSVTNIIFSDCNVSQTGNSAGIIANTIGNESEAIVCMSYFDNIKFINCTVASDSDTGLIAGKTVVESVFQASNITLEEENSVLGNSSAGGLIGYVSSDTSASISSVEMGDTAKLKVESSSGDAGGIIGMANSPEDYNGITINYANLNNIFVTAGLDAGGLIGNAKLNRLYMISNTVSHSSIKGSENVGGLIGEIKTADSSKNKVISLSSCETEYTNVYSTSTLGEFGVGGIIGKTPMETILSGLGSDRFLNLVSTCNYIHGEENSTISAGGLIGWIYDEYVSTTSAPNRTSDFNSCNIKQNIIIGNYSGIYVGKCETIAMDDVNHTQEIIFRGTDSVINNFNTCIGTSGAGSFIGYATCHLPLSSTTAPTNFTSMIKTTSDCLVGFSYNVVRSDNGIVDIGVNAGIGFTEDVAGNHVWANNSVYHDLDNNPTNWLGYLVEYLTFTETVNVKFTDVSSNTYVSEATKDIVANIQGSTISLKSDGTIEAKSTWDYGDGSFIAESTNLELKSQHTYSTYGTYNVSVTISDLLSNTTLTKNGNIVYGAPELPTITSISVTPLTCTAGTTVHGEVTYTYPYSDITGYGWYEIISDTIWDEIGWYNTQFDISYFSVGTHTIVFAIYTEHGSVTSQNFILTVTQGDAPTITSTTVTPSIIRIGDTVIFDGQYTLASGTTLTECWWEKYDDDYNEWTPFGSGAHFEEVQSDTQNTYVRFCVIANDVLTSVSDKIKFTVYSTDAPAFDNITISSDVVAPNQNFTVGATVIAPSGMTIVESGWEFCDEYDNLIDYKTTLNSATFSYDTGGDYYLYPYAKDSNGNTHYGMDIHLTIVEPVSINLYDENSKKIGTAKIAFGGSTLSDLDLPTGFIPEGYYSSSNFTDKLFDNTGNCVMENYYPIITNYKWSSAYLYNLYVKQSASGLSIDNVNITPNSGTAIDDFTLNCLASNTTGTTTYIWFKSSDKINWGTSIGNGAITTINLPAGTWYFKCVVEDSVSTKDSFSDYTTFKGVEARVSTAPLTINSVSVNPSSGYLTSTYTLNCQALGGSGTLTYNWYKSEDKTSWGSSIGTSAIQSVNLTKGTWYFKCIVTDGTETKDSFNDYTTFQNVSANVADETKWQEILESSTKGMTASILIAILVPLAIIGIMILMIATRQDINPATAITTAGVLIVIVIIIIILAGGFNGVGIDLFSK